MSFITQKTVNWRFSLAIKSFKQKTHTIIAAIRWTNSIQPWPWHRARAHIIIFSSMFTGKLKKKIHHQWQAKIVDNTHSLYSFFYIFLHYSFHFIMLNFTIQSKTRNKKKLHCNQHNILTIYEWKIMYTQPQHSECAEYVCAVHDGDGRTRSQA